MVVEKDYLTENFYQEAPSWSPNGRVLIFYRETKTDSDGKRFFSKIMVNRPYWV